MGNPVADDGSLYNNTQHSGNRLGNWMQTYRGAQFWPLDPRPEEIFIEDIAHSLSNACRFAGHCEYFYSVAQHSVYVSLLVPPEMALCALLHDATETYLVDVPRPIKPSLVGYSEIEHHLWTVIAKRFNLPEIMPKEIKLADNAMLLAERDQIMKAECAPWCLEGDPAPIKIEPMTPTEAKEFFLNRYNVLSL